MRNKVIFLDIDGTMTNFKGEFPRSAEIALERARKNGHLLVPCTGRTNSQIFPWMLKGTFAGLISGAGAYVRAGEQVVFHHFLEPGRLTQAVEYFETKRTPYYLQAVQAIYTSRWVIDERNRIFAGDVMAEAERDRMFGKVCEDMNPGMRTDVEKLVYYQSEETVEQVKKALGPYFCVTASSFELTNQSDGEVTCAGINKAEGMRRYLEYYGISREDTLAIGDGPNDLEMLQYAATGVAMGNAADSLKAAADLVTGCVDEDGLYQAFERLGLI